MNNMNKCVLFLSSLIVFFSMPGAISFARPGVTAKENLQTLLKTRSCRGCYLAEINFNRMDLSGVDLENADLSRATFNLANLSGANLQNARCNGTVFGGTDLGESDLRGADLRGASLNTAYLGGAQMTGEILTTRTYNDIVEVEWEIYSEDSVKPKEAPETAGVTTADPEGHTETPPTKPVIRKRPVTDAGSIGNTGDMVPGVTTPATPRAKTARPVGNVVIAVPEKDAVDQRAKGAERARQAAPASGLAGKSVPVVAAVVAPAVKKIKKSGEIIEKITNGTTVSGKVNEQRMKEKALARLLEKNRCYECDLAGVDLSGEDLEEVDLEKANLARANLEEADLEDGNLKGADLRDAVLRKCDLRGTDFYKADLRGADLTGAKLDGAMFDGARLDGVIGIDSAVMSN